MSSSASNTAPTTNNNNNNNNSAGFTPSGDVIQILNNEYKSILSDLNLKKFPKIKETIDKSLIKLKELNDQKDILVPNSQNEITAPIFAMLTSEKNFLSTEKSRKSFFNVMKPLIFNHLITNTTFTKILKTILAKNNSYLTLSTGTTSFFIVQLIQILTFSLNTLPKNAVTAAPTTSKINPSGEEEDDDDELVDIDINNSGEAKESDANNNSNNNNNSNIDEKKEDTQHKEKESANKGSEEEDIIFSIFSIFFVIYYNFVFSGNTSILNSANETIVRNTITTTFPMLINMLLETILKSNIEKNVAKSQSEIQSKTENEIEKKSEGKRKHKRKHKKNNNNNEEENDEERESGSSNSSDDDNDNDDDDDDDESSSSSSDDDDDDDDDDNDDNDFSKLNESNDNYISDDDDEDGKSVKRDTSTQEHQQQEESKPTESQQTPLKPACFDGVFHLFDDICTMTLGEKPQYLTDLPVPFQPAIGLDVIELVINSHPEVFHDYDEFKTLISTKICPAVVRLFDNCESFRVFARLGRLVNTLASKFMSEAPKVIESLLTRFSSFLYLNTQVNAKTVNWQQTVVLEVFRTLFSSPDIVCKMYYYYDMKDSDKNLMIPKRSVSRHIVYTSVRKSITVDGDEEDEYDNRKDAKNTIADNANGANSIDNAGTNQDEEEESDTEEEMTDVKLGDDDDDDDVNANTQINNDEVESTENSLNASSSSSNNVIDARNEQPGTSPRLVQSPQEFDQTKSGEKGEEKSRLLTRTAETISNLLCTLPFKTSFIMEGPSTQNAALQSVIDLGSDTEQPPTINPRYKATVALQCILNLSHSLWSIAGHIPDDVHTHKNIGALITDSTYESNFKGLYTTLDHTGEESTIQFILKGYYNNIYALSVYGLDKGISLYVNSLCRYATYSASASTGILSVIPLRKNSLMVPPRTVEAMRTLMSVIHCMGSSLSACWRTILLTVESIDKIMTQEAVQKNSAVEDEPNDFGIAAVALSTLFESTIQTETNSFLLMFEELVKLALERVGTNDHFTEVPGTGKTTCFFFNKVIETAQFNASRIDCIWDIYTAFFRAAIRHSSNIIWNSGITSLKEIIILTLKSISSNSKDPYTSSTDQLLEMQTRFFALVEEAIFSEDVMLNVKVALLDSLRVAVKEVGNDLTFGWDKLLETIYNSVKIGDKEIAPTVFTIVQLIGSEFLPKLPEAKSTDLIEKDALYNYIKVVSSYVLQQDNETISMSSIDLIWEIGTYLSTIEEESQQQRRVLLWELLINEVKNHCNDERDQVRNSSIVNLLKVLRTYSGCFIEHTWYLCIWDVLFPIINFIKLHVTSISVVTERGPPKTPMKGERSATDLTLQRKSEDEVRNENWCLSMRIILKEICGLFKSSINQKHMTTLPRFEEAWRQLCEYLRSCALDIPAQDVGECTIESTIVLLTVAATDLGFERSFWELTLDTLAAIVSAVSTRSPNKKTSQIFANMVHTLGEMIAANTESVQPEDVVRIVDIIAPLPMLPIDDELGQEGITTMHTEVLTFCKNIQKLPQNVCNEAVTEKIIVLLAQYPQQALVARYQKQGEAPSEREQRRWTGILTFSAASIKLSAEIFNSETTTPSVRENVLPDFIKAVEDALMARHREAPQMIQKTICSVWVHLFSAFTAIVDNGTEAIKSGDKEKCWTDIIEVSTDLIFFDKKTQNAVVASTVTDDIDVKERCTLCASLIDVSTKALIKNGEKYPGVGSKLVETLFAGAKVAVTIAPELCRDCYHGAFVLAANDVSRDDLISETSLLVVNQAKDVIEKFNESKDKEREVLHTEVICVLNELKDFRTTLQDPPKAAGDSPRGFLLKLFGVLCESTSSKEKDVKAAVKDLLDVVGNEFLGI